MNVLGRLTVGIGRQVLQSAAGQVTTGLPSRTAAAAAARGTWAATVPFITSVRNLPVCSVSTNLNDAQVPKDFLGGLSKIIAATLSKPEKSISVSVSTNIRMYRSGCDGPSVVIEIWSIGVFDAERNKKYSKDIFKYIATELKNIPEDRITLLFHPLQKEDAGHLIYKT